jgi:uroporphyrin-3 C-methyltransferase
MSAEIESLVIDGSSRRSGSGVSPMLVAVAVIALLAALFAHWRMGRALESLDLAQARITELQGTRAVLGAQQSELATRLESELAELRAQVAALRELPSQVDELSRSQAELRARTDTPQRAWVRAEALYLLDLAGRRLDLEGDAATALVALETADARLATLKDPALSPVRSQLAREIEALRAAPVPDVPAVLLRLGAAEARTKTLPVLGTPVSKGQRAELEPGTSGPFDRAWRRISTALHDLLSLRRVEPMNARLVTQEEEALRRQHLQLLYLAARVAAMQGNDAAYQQALRSAASWIEQGFDPRSPSVTAAQSEIGDLLRISVETTRPAIGTAAEMLRRATQTSGS